jgi:hypothetical protein
MVTERSRSIAVKKTHIVKNNILCDNGKRILWLSRTFDGSVYDKKIMDEHPVHFPAGITLWQDTGFLGHTPEDVTVMMPTKKPKGGDLTDEQQQQNRMMSSYRVVVEHAICGVKLYRIVKERVRCTKFGFEDTVMRIACGLHNLRIMMKENAIKIKQYNVYCFCFRYLFCHWRIFGKK